MNSKQSLTEYFAKHRNESLEAFLNDWKTRNTTTISCKYICWRKQNNMYKTFYTISSVPTSPSGNLLVHWARGLSCRLTVKILLTGIFFINFCFVTVFWSKQTGGILRSIFSIIFLERKLINFISSSTEVCSYGLQTQNNVSALVQVMVCCRAGDKWTNDDLVHRNIHMRHRAPVC